MKHFSWLVLLGVLFLVLTGCGGYRRANKITLIAELPNSDEFVIDEAFVDIGIAYNTISLGVLPLPVISDLPIISDLSLLNFNRRWVLFDRDTRIIKWGGDRTRYWVVDKERLDEIAGWAGITLQSDMSLPYWDEWGGRIILGGLVIFGLLIFLPSKKKK